MVPSSCWYVKEGRSSSMNINIITFSVIAILSIFIMYLLLKNRRMSKQIDLSNQNIASLYIRLSELTNQKNDSDLEKTEGFIKFLSDSRNWAFDYIEDVQRSLSVFDKRITKVIDYYSTYGSVIDGPHTEMVKQVSEAYNELKSVLPKDDKEV